MMIKLSQADLNILKNKNRCVKCGRKFYLRHEISCWVKTLDGKPKGIICQKCEEGKRCVKAKTKNRWTQDGLVQRKKRIDLISRLEDLGVDIELIPLEKFTTTKLEGLVVKMEDTIYGKSELQESVA